MDSEKREFINFLRRKLKNSNINVTYKVAEVTAVREFSDNKSKFAKLKEENPSLEKFRKLFSLDIEF